MVLHTLFSLITLYGKDACVMKKRADGRYCKQVLIGYSPNGKRKFKTIYGKTIKEVEKKEREIKDSIEKGLSIEDSIILGEWSDMWLSVYKNNVEYNTRAMYENAINKHIKPELGMMQLKNLKSIHIQKLLNKLIDGEHYRTAEVVKLTIKQILKQALIEGYINRDITASIKIVTKKSPEKRTLTRKEVEAINNASLSQKQKVFIDIMHYTGLRKGESLALKKDDIDIFKKTIKVDKSLYYKANDAFIKEPKSRAGYRTVPIPNTLIKELGIYVQNLKTDILFPMNNGNYMTKSSFRKFWDSIISCIGDQIGEKPDITPHIFRHTYATNLYRSGIDEKRAQYFLGHSSIQMTMDVYTHLDKQEVTNEIDKLNDYLEKEMLVKC